MKVKVIDCTSSLWTMALDKCVHDVYHSENWVVASEAIDKGRAHAVFVESDGQIGLFPFLKRQIERNSWDASSPYGYGGPIISCDSPSNWLQESMAAAVLKLKEEGCVSWFVRLHPLLNEAFQSDLGLVVDHGKTVSVDLLKTEEEHWKETRSGHRGDIRKSLKAGVTLSYEKDEHTLRAFVDIYRDTMRALNADEYYLFDDKYFYDLVALLNENLLLVTAHEGGVCIGGSMFTICKSSGIMQYHLSGTSTAYRHRQPSKLILHEARAWGRSNGLARLHLGGGLAAKEDALYKFKAGFSNDSHLFQSLRIVVDDKEYSRLCMSRNLPDLDPREFFPAYRAGKEL